MSTQSIAVFGESLPVEKAIGRKGRKNALVLAGLSEKKSMQLCRLKRLPGMGAMFFSFLAMGKRKKPIAFSMALLWHCAVAGQKNIRNDFNFKIESHIMGEKWNENERFISMC